MAALAHDSYGGGFAFLHVSDNYFRSMIKNGFTVNSGTYRKSDGTNAALSGSLSSNAYESGNLILVSISNVPAGSTLWANITINQ